MSYRDKKSGAWTILLLVVGFFLIAGLYKGFIIGLAALVTTDVAPYILLGIFLIIGWFGFFYKPKE